MCHVAVAAPIPLCTPHVTPVRNGWLADPSVACTYAGWSVAHHTLCRTAIPLHKRLLYP